MTRLPFHIRLPFKLLASLVVVASIQVGCTLGSHREELGESFNHYLIFLQEAQITLDTSSLAEVAEEPRLTAAITGVENRREFDVIASEEFRVGRVRVLSYSDTEASAEIRWHYRSFIQDFDTGERDYGPTERWYWRDVRVVFVRDDEVWKVAEIHVLDWSG